LLEQGLVTLLTETSGVTELVGDRIYPVQGPPDNPTYPFITYLVASGNSDYGLDGTEARMKRIQFDSWSLSSLTNLQILTALRNVLTGFVGTLPDGTRVLFAARLNEMSDFDNDTKSYRSICEYEFQFVEA
jgi:hypothetical protein